MPSHIIQSAIFQTRISHFFIIYQHFNAKSRIFFNFLLLKPNLKKQGQCFQEANSRKSKKKNKENECWNVLIVLLLKEKKEKRKKFGVLQKLIDSPFFLV